MSQVTEFLHMGGYAFYVWSSFLLSLIVMAAHLIQPWRREKRILRELRNRQIREANRS